MNFRNILLLAGLAAFLAGCVIHPRPYPPRDYDQRYGDEYYDYRGTPSYEGYYYARIIFIRDVPYYVDDDHYVRPIPPGLHDHFRRYPYNTLGRPPMFSRDNEVRDGYRMSHIIYLDGVPYHVENDHSAQPLPERLHQRFRYTPDNQGNAPANGNRPQPSNQHDNGRNNEPPGHDQDRGHDRGRDQDQGRDLNQGRNQDRQRDERGQSARDHERIAQPPFERGQREGGKDTSADSKEKIILSPEPHSLPLRQDQPKAGESHANTPSVKERGRNANRPQAIDDSGNKKTDRKKSRQGKKDKKGDSPQADDDSGNKKDNRREPRNDNRRD